MHKKLFLATGLAAVVALSAAEEKQFGIVNFGDCATQSKTGQHEQESFETLRNQLSSMMESTDKELKEISAKFEDSDYLDSLSPKAEEELRAKQEELQGKLNGYQQQFYQLLSHANHQMIYKIRSAVESAAAKVAEENQLKYVLNQEFCFYVHPDLDVTHQVIAEMDKTFEQDLATKEQSEKANDEAVQAE